jgi:hypothetical protein
MSRKDGIRIEPSLRENPDENARLLERSPSRFSWQSSWRLNDETYQEIALWLAKTEYTSSRHCEKTLMKMLLY